MAGWVVGGERSVDPAGYGDDCPDEMRFAFVKYVSLSLA